MQNDEYLRQALSTLERINLGVYGPMWGPNEYILMDTAPIRGWDVRDRISDINIPTLALSGGCDEIKPSIASDIADHFPDSEIHVFEESSHMHFWEEPDAHYDVFEPSSPNSATSCRIL